MVVEAIAVAAEAGGDGAGGGIRQLANFWPADLAESRGYSCDGDSIDPPRMSYLEDHTLVASRGNSPLAVFCRFLLPPLSPSPDINWRRLL